MTKEEKIKDVYGSFYNPHIDEDGWFDMKYAHFINEMDVLWELSYIKGTKLRPKDLEGIESNNGWIKIKNNDDLPKVTNSLWLKFDDGSIVLGRFQIFKKVFESVNFKIDERDKVTHYKIIQNPKPPLF